MKMENSTDILEVNAPTENNANEKIHSWRICPVGQHYVRTHPENIHPSKIHPDGEAISRQGHCANNPTHKNSEGKERSTKDILSFPELQIIAETHFHDLQGPPKANILEFKNEAKFDSLIRGWVYYWNAVFKAKDPLDPNLVKALIAGESSFIPDKTNSTGSKKLGIARGLMQLTDDTLKKINGHEIELKDNFIHLTTDEAMDPAENICAGTRWLFMKYAGARERFTKEGKGHIATWDDAVAEYKGLLKGMIDHKNDPKNYPNEPDPYNAMPTFRAFYKQLLEG